MCRKAHFRRGREDDDNKGIDGALEGASQIPAPTAFAGARGTTTGREQAQDARGPGKRTGEWTRTRRGAEPLGEVEHRDRNVARQEPHGWRRSSWKDCAGRASD